MAGLLVDTLEPVMWSGSPARKVAIILLGVTIISHGITAFLPWHVLVVLTFHLSWAAIEISALTFLWETKINEKVEDMGGD